ncbi:hypothetical protein AW27_019510 [Streptomyces sp. PCS3-D2]|uniref:hypothetical protein n=1 Tax=Streptomyces sp. PCS3-D2 TaxID=1460244 RepID=UPI001F3B7D54|nr:hypothetical protein [Streptomyces sp. PCS3-D2]WKV73515.1 hypothetical protein AW27_019510 [Streptomyces sp. PCS3-D2]
MFHQGPAAVGASARRRGDDLTCGGGVPGRGDAWSTGAVDWVPAEAGPTVCAAQDLIPHVTRDL